MSLKETYWAFWRNTFKFSCRATRKQYWGPQLFHLGVFFSLVLCVMITDRWHMLSKLFIILFAAYFILILFPNFSLGIRRLHDANKSAWFILLRLPLINVIGYVVLFIFTLLPSTDGNNRFGPHPLVKRFDDVSNND